MSSSYRITEPHPTVPSTHYIYSGRGGAGNVSHVNPKKLTSGPDASGPAFRTSISTAPQSSSPSERKLSTSSNNYYSAGRGGSGNMNSYQPERPIFSFDEELERQRKMQEHMAPHYHVGRGGAGNSFGTTPSMPERRSSAFSASGSSSGSSVESANSVKGGRVLGDAWSRLKTGFGK